jgi:hypothetical protein
MNEPKRRGRPPANQTAIASGDIEVGDMLVRNDDGTVSAAKRRRRASVGGHALKLEAPTRAGFVRRWVNDDNNRIAKADDLAYDFVTDTSIQGTGEGSRVSRLVGTKPNGEPLRAYLMETPVEEYQAGLAEKEAVNRQIDDAITRGEDSTDQLAPKAEQYGSGSITQDR